MAALTEGAGVVTVEVEHTVDVTHLGGAVDLLLGGILERHTLLHVIVVHAIFLVGLGKGVGGQGFAKMGRNQFLVAHHSTKGMAKGGMVTAQPEGAVFFAAPVHPMEVCVAGLQFLNLLSGHHCRYTVMKGFFTHRRSLPYSISRR